MCTHSRLHQVCARRSVSGCSRWSAPCLGAADPFSNEETIMGTSTRAIQWQHDVDAALAQASSAHRPVLLDFTAAPQ